LLALLVRHPAYESSAVILGGVLVFLHDRFAETLWELPDDALSVAAIVIDAIGNFLLGAIVAAAVWGMQRLWTQLVARELFLLRPAKLVRTLWTITAVVFFGSLIIFLAVAGRNVLTPGWWWSPVSLVGGVLWYCISGWCLIPLPFAIAAIVASLAVKARPTDSEKVRLAIKVALWGIGVVVVGLALYFLFFMLMAGSSGHLYKE
jgi:hypothetical protein